MTITKLITSTGEITRTGTCGFTVTSNRVGDQTDVQIEWDKSTPEEMKAMVGVMLCWLEHLEGERFVANCIAHYAEETGKQFFQEGDHKIGIIRGHTRR